MAAVREKKEDLEYQIEEAEGSTDYDRFEKIDEYREGIRALEKYSMDAMLKHNKQEKNAADAVRKAIQEAIKKIEPFHPLVAAHLKKYIGTGYSLQYSPAEKIDWKTS